MEGLDEARDRAAPTAELDPGAERGRRLHIGSECLGENDEGGGEVLGSARREEEKVATGSF